MIKYIFLALLLTISLKLSAQTIVTDRPDQTESSITLGKGELQIESGILFGTAEDDYFSEELLIAPTVLWRYGIADGIELRLLTEFASVKYKLTSEKASGLSDLQVGTKIQLLKKEDIKTEIAFLSHLIIPTAKEALTLDEIGSINKLSIAHDIGDTFSLGYNIGYDYYGFGSGNLTYSIALGLSISDKVSFYIEPYGGLVELAHHESNFDSGITYFVQENLQLDVSAGTGLNHKMNYVSLGCSINIARNNKQ